MNEQDFRQLADRYVTGDMSPEETNDFLLLLEEEQHRNMLGKVMQDDWNQGLFQQDKNPHLEKLIEEYVIRAINPAEVAPVRRMTFLRKYRVAIAAAFILVIAGTSWLLFDQLKPDSQSSVTTGGIATVDILPGSDGAILTLANGEQVIVDSVSTGIIAQQGGSSIVKKNGELTYEQGKGGALSIYNTLSTPRGKQYKNLVLADGTKVWLDAGSSIRFPVSFEGKNREVEVTGQVWFDVVHDDSKPFRVKAKGIEITDLGTEFNVDAYADENILRVTLLEGIVMIKGTVLKPGEQAQIPEREEMTITNNIDLEEVTAWKNGFFKFNNADLKTVIRHIARWYDVDVSYEGDIPDQTFSGSIGRNLSLKDLLEGLAFTNVKFRIEGRKLIVLP